MAFLDDQEAARNTHKTKEQAAYLQYEKAVDAAAKALDDALKSNHSEYEAKAQEIGRKNDEDIQLAVLAAAEAEAALEAETDTKQGRKKKEKPAK